MKREDVKIGNVVTLDDGRRAKITLVHPDYSFECDFVTDDILETKEEIQEVKNEKEETVKTEVKKEAPKKAAKQTKPVRKTKK